MKKSLIKKSLHVTCYMVVVALASISASAVQSSPSYANSEFFTT